MKKNILAFLMVIVLIGSFAGCGNSSESAVETESKKAEIERVQIITTLFPQYDFVREIVGDKGRVTLIVPPGVEAHAYEPTPQDIVSIHRADLFIYTGEAMEPWAHKVIETVGEDNIMIVEAGEGLFDMTTEPHNHENHEDNEDHEAHDDHDDQEDHDDHDHGGVDPHVWLDPIKAQDMVEHILSGLIKAAPEHAEEFRMNAEAYIAELDTLHHDFEEVFEKTESKTIMSGGHFAFGHFINRYGLNYESPYVGFAPDAEPSPKKIAELIESVKTSNTKAIFYEELVDPRVAKIVAEETEAEMLLLHAAHNLSKEELESGITYIDIMRKNLESLKTGLNYKEGE